MTPTPIDTAHAHMTSHPNDDSARLEFLTTIVQSELFLLLDHTTKQTDDITPQTFKMDNADFVLVFDCADRLADFHQQPDQKGHDHQQPNQKGTEFINLSGRQLIGWLTSKTLGMGLNLEVAKSAFVLAPDDIAWLADTFCPPLTHTTATAHHLRPPAGITDTLLKTLNTQLGQTLDAADCGYLAFADYKDAASGHLLAFINPANKQAENALIQAVSEVLIVCAQDMQNLQIAFFHDSAAITGELEKVAVRIDLPQTGQTPQRQSPPGMDRAHPPKIRG